MTDSDTPRVEAGFERFFLPELALTRSATCRDEIRELARANPLDLFPNARNPHAALSGLMLRSGCWEASHTLSQDDPSSEGSYWHAIAHRMEPDSWNSKYWFGCVGRHPIFEKLLTEAAVLLRAAPGTGWNPKPVWDPALFIGWCEEARQRPGSDEERVATAIQSVECKLLLEWCAAASNSATI